MALKDRQSWLDALRAAGLKLTPQRLAIVDCLADDRTHPTAQELHERLHRRYPTLAVATIYNTLQALTQIGRCQPLQMGGVTRFDPNVGPHDHAVCDRCGSIRDVEQGRAPSDDARAALTNFEVQRVERIYRGLCARCAQAA